MSLPQEYPAWGTGDTREAAFKVTFSDGSRASRLEYQEHEQIKGAIQPQQMAFLSTHTATTLRIRLADPRGDFAVDLFYIFDENSPALIRWVRFINTGHSRLLLEDPASFSLDLPAEKQDLLRLHGAWGRERHVQRIPLSPGQFSTGSSNGASSHQTSPFFAICEQGCDESQGIVQAFALAYSGNFSARCLVDENKTCRISMGIQQLQVYLAQGERFDTAPAVLVNSWQGFSDMSNRFHRCIRKSVIAPRWQNEPKKIIINSWEALYFDVNAEKIVDLAHQGKAIGAELLVLDDGWFSNRRDDRRSLGDWWHNSELFPAGLGAVGDAVREVGLEFGLWLEPEMVSPESELFHKHPEWVLQVTGRKKTEARHQLILDLTNPEVIDYLVSSITDVLTEARPSYIKWDMNRNMTEAGSPSLPPEKQGETMHRYILGLYSLLEHIQERFPHILIEGCAGGGGRFDLGLARFSPRFWTSDQTDAVERLPIQYGSSLLFPPEMMGAHVSAIPNHQVGRNTPAWTRSLTALPFSFGFELNPSTISDQDIAIFRQASTYYKAHRSVFHQGDFIRLQGPLAAGAPPSSSDASGEYAWMIRSPNKRDLFIFYFRALHPGTRPPASLRLHSIAESGINSYKDNEDGRAYQRQVLEQKGIPLPKTTGDYYGIFRHLTAL